MLLLKRNDTAPMERSHQQILVLVDAHAGAHDLEYVLTSYFRSIY